jgi:hypothetical protein
LGSVLFIPIRHQLIFERGGGTNPEHRPNFNFNEIVYRLRPESFLEVLEVDIRAIRDCQAMAEPAHLQAKAPAHLAEKLNVLPAGIIGHFQRLADIDDTAGDR